MKIGKSTKDCKVSLYMGKIPSLSHVDTLAQINATSNVYPRGSESVINIPQGYRYIILEDKVIIYSKDISNCLICNAELFKLDSLAVCTNCILPYIL